MGGARWAALAIDAPVGRVIGAATQRAGAAVLDSAAVDAERGRYSIIGLGPIDRIEAADPGGASPFEALEDHLRTNRIAAGDEPVPLAGGWIGHIGYEAGGWFESIPVSRPRLVNLPLVRFDLYDTLLIFDHAARRWYVAGIEWNGRGRYKRPAFADRCTDARRWLDAAAGESAASEAIPPAGSPQPTLTQVEYESRVRRAIEYIGAGDIYQVNFAHQVLVEWPGGGPALYRRLREHNPASYAAYLADGRQAILSSSPELFLEVRGRAIRTRPIKGTRPRTGDAIIDASNRAELLASAKDHAELAMIVDLERNDLGRVCAFGSVGVAEPFVLEEHPTVYHLVATVTGTLRDDVGPIDVLRATFPGGSITGAPKIRAMQIIDELETHQRGPYCGSIGAIGLDGSVLLNIAIRTIVLDGNKAIVPVGSGIVADSDPGDEYEETLAKARGMLGALGAGAIGCTRSTA